MTVLVTGGSGFLGTHTVAAVAGLGHRVKVLARDAAAAEAAIAALDVAATAIDIVAGDVTDDKAVARAVRGVEHVIHAASVYSFDSRRRGDIRRINERGTNVVLDAARRAGVRRTIHVSSFGALLPAAGRVVRPQSPPGTAREPYLASKAAAERVARRHQDEGAPVVITYPPALLGPSDPRLGDQNNRLRAMLRGLMPVWPGGGFPIGDVRDTAAMHAALLDAPDSDGNRFFGPGRYVSTRDFVRTVRVVCARPFPTLFLPAAALLPMAAVADVLQRVWPWQIPAQYGACYVCVCDSRVESAPPVGRIVARPLTETLAGTVRWMHAAGHISAAQAGLAVADGATVP